MIHQLFESPVVRTDVVCNQPVEHGWHRTIFVLTFSDGQALNVTIDEKPDGWTKCSICKEL